MMTEATKPSFSRLEYMNLVGNPMNMANSELEYLIDSPAFSPYSDAHCVDNDDWKDFD